MGYELRRNVILELKLQVAKSKLIRLRFEVESFLGTFNHSEADPERVKEAAARLEEINNELQNTAPNLHAE